MRALVSYVLYTQGLQTWRFWTTHICLVWIASVYVWVKLCHSPCHEFYQGWKDKQPHWIRVHSYASRHLYVYPWMRDFAYLRKFPSPTYLDSHRCRSAGIDPQLKTLPNPPYPPNLRFSLFNFFNQKWPVLSSPFLKPCFSSKFSVKGKVNLD